MQAAAHIGKVSNILIPSVVAIVATTEVAFKKFTEEDLKDCPKEASKDLDKINDCYEEF